MWASEGQNHCNIIFGASKALGFQEIQDNDCFVMLWITLRAECWDGAAIIHLCRIYLKSLFYFVIVMTIWNHRWLNKLDLSYWNVSDSIKTEPCYSQQSLHYYFDESISLKHHYSDPKICWFEANPSNAEYNCLCMYKLAILLPQVFAILISVTKKSLNQSMATKYAYFNLPKTWTVKIRWRSDLFSWF